MMCWHKWGKWEDYAEGYLRVEYDPFTYTKLEDSQKYMSGKFIRQKRVCSKCGKVQLRREMDT